MTSGAGSRAKAQRQTRQRQPAGSGLTRPAAPAVAAAAVLGFFGHGASLVLFVLALRHLGTARTDAYFSVAPGRRAPVD
jgi:hypothetical protein